MERILGHVRTHHPASVCKDFSVSGKWSAGPEPEDEPVSKIQVQQMSLICHLKQRQNVQNYENYGCCKCSADKTGYKGSQQC